MKSVVQHMFEKDLLFIEFTSQQNVTNKGKSSAYKREELEIYCCEFIENHVNFLMEERSHEQQGLQLS